MSRRDVRVVLLELVEALEAYESTSAFTIDALDELATRAPEELPPPLLDAVRRWYRGTGRYADTIEDIRTGDRELA